MGKTNARQAEPGTIRGDFGHVASRTTSCTAPTAPRPRAKELALFFPDAARALRVDAREPALGLQRRKSADRARRWASRRAHVGELVRELAPLVRGATLRDVQALPAARPAARARAARGRAARSLRLRLSADPDAPRLHLQTRARRAPRGPARAVLPAPREELAGRRAARARRRSRGDRIVRLDFRRDGQPARARWWSSSSAATRTSCCSRRGRRVLDVLVPPPPAHGRGRAPRARQPSRRSPPGRARGPARRGRLWRRPFPRRRGRAPAPSALAPALARASSARSAARADGARAARAARASSRERLERTPASARALARGPRAARAPRAPRPSACGRTASSAQGHLARDRARRDVEVELDGLLRRRTRAPRRIALDPKLSPRRERRAALRARYKKLAAHARALSRRSSRARAGDARAARGAARARAAAERRPRGARGRGGRGGPARARRRSASRARSRGAAPRAPLPPFHGAARAARSASAAARATTTSSPSATRAATTSGCTRPTRPGSHVVLRLEKGAEPDPEEVLDAAHLAVHFSPLRGAPRADVHVARRKEVHKPRRPRPAW